MGRLCLALVLVVMTGASADAIPVVLFDNFGPGYSYNENGGWNVVGREVFGNQEVTAVGFVPASSYALDSIAAAVGIYWNPQNENSLNLALYDDNGGHPGTNILESWFVSGMMSPFDTDNAPVIANSSLHPLLSAGTRYWVVAQAGTDTLSLQSRQPCSSSCTRKARQMPSHSPSSSHRESRRQHVLGLGYSSGRSCPRAPVRKIHRMPSSTLRSSHRGRPPLGPTALGG